MAKKSYAMRALAFLLALLLVGGTMSFTADAAPGGWGGGGWGSGTVDQVTLYWCYSHRATGGSYTKNLDQATATYNGSSWGFGSGVTLTANSSASITISPKPGYRVARIDMLCTNTDNRLNPYNCLTYNEGASYRVSAVTGSTSISLNNFTIKTACNHASRSTKYYMMVTLEEVEEEQTYTVTYTPGEGIGTDYVDNNAGAGYAFADSYTVAAVTAENIGFTNPGYTFAGWKVTSCTDTNSLYNLVGNTYQGGETFGMPAGNVVLTAQWEKILVPTYDYSVIYHANYEGNDATEADSENVLGVTDTTKTIGIDGNPFSRPGYTFLGWATEPQGAVVYQAGMSITFNQGGKQDLYAQWQEIPKYAYELTYHANFAPNESVSDAENIDRVYDTTYTMTVDANPFVRENYTFTGWNTAPDGSGIAYAPGAAMALTAENNTEDLYAQWQEIPKYDYAVIYHPGFGEDTAIADSENVQQVYDTEKTITVDANPFLRPNYTFLGWATEEGGAVVYLPGDAIAFTLGGEEHLYAKWAENDKYAYTLVYNGNGGALADGALAYGDAENVENVYDTAKTFGIDANTFLRENFDFLGWNTAPDGSGTAYAPGEELTLTAANSTATLYAQWQEHPKYDYTVTYHANFGEVAPVADAENALQVYDTTKIIGIDGNPFSRPGYTFLGWATEPQGAVVYQAGMSVSFIQGGNLDLYAQWQEIPKYDYTVTYYANFGEVAPVADAENALQVYDTTKIIGIDSNPFSRPGYTFLGWATEPQGAVVYQAGMSVSFTQGGNLDLYAQWQEVPKYAYELTYHANFAPNESVSDAENIDRVYDTTYTMTVDANRFVRENYTFIGWNTAPDGSGAAYAPGETLALTAENNTAELYAQWQENPKYAYSLTYHANFAPNQSVSDAENIDRVYDVTYNMGVDANPFARENYTFIGWNTAADGSGTSYAPGAVVAFTAENSTEELYAQWQENPKYDYSVIYHPGFGEATAIADAENVQQVYDTEKTITVDANPFQRPNYTFLGWATEADGAVVYLPGDAIAFTLGGQQHLYAKWAEHDKYAYTLVYNGNGGALADGTLAYGDAENVENVYDTTKTFGVDTNTFVRENYEFLGWNTAPDGSGTAYAPGAELTLTAEQNTATLYAQWQEHPKYDYTVTYHANFGEVAPVADAENALQVYDTAKTMGVDANPFVRDQYDFLGWNTAPDGSGTAYAPEDVLAFQLGGEMDLYAQWQIKTYSYRVEYFVRIDGGLYLSFGGKLPEGTITGGEAPLGAVIDRAVVAPPSELRDDGIRYDFVVLESTVIVDGENVVRVFYQHKTYKDEVEEPDDPTPPTPPIIPVEPTPEEPTPPNPDEPELIDIPDEDVPLADVPKTGDPMLLYSALCLACTGGFLWLKKKEEE